MKAPITRLSSNGPHATPRGDHAFSDPPLRHVELPQGRIAHTDEGPAGAPALFALHGVPGSVRDFRYLAPHLTDAVRLLRVDLPGFGESPPAEEAVRTLEGRAAVVTALADLLRLERFAVLGHSMGGATALVLAARDPERVSLAVLVASMALTPHRALGVPPPWFRPLAAALERPLLARALVPLLRTQYRRLRFAGAERMTAADFALHCRAVAAADTGLLRRAAASPRPRTMLAFAEDDPLVQPWIQAELAAAMPDARVLRFAEGGHHLQKTRAAEVAAAMREELGLSPAAAT